MAQKGDLQLSIGYWIVSHKQTLRTWWGVGSMLIITGCLLWSVIFFSLFISQDKKMSTMVISTAAATGEYRTSFLTPQELTFSPVTIIARDAQHVDLVTDVTNSNVAWGVRAMTVHFLVDGIASMPQTLFLNQESSRPVMQINMTVKTLPSSADLIFDDIQWVRASAAALPPASFTVSKIRIDPSTLPGQSLSSFSVQAEVKNESVYNFYRVEIPILLLNGKRIVGTGFVSKSDWQTLSSKGVALTPGYPISDVTEVRIEPQVSRFDYGNTYR